MIKHYIMSNGGFGIPLIILIGIIYIAFAISILKRHKRLLILNTILFIIIEWILIYMYTAHK